MPALFTFSPGLQIVLPKSEAMRAPKLQRQSTVWSSALLRRVVRLIREFREIRIFRDVRHRLQQFVTDLFFTLAAKRKRRLPRENHFGARLIGVAYFVQPGFRHAATRLQRTVRLIESIGFLRTSFHFYSPRPKYSATRTEVINWKQMRSDSSNATVGMYFWQERVGNYRIPRSKFHSPCGGNNGIPRTRKIARAKRVTIPNEAHSA